MPKRLAFYLTLQLLVCTSAFAQSPSVTANETTLWDHNGSVMYLIVSGLSREFYYKEPRPGMLDVGARPDSLLFRGQIKDGRFSGTAYIFNLHCGQVPFDVKGPILDNNERVVLTGQAQRVGRNCQTHGYYTSNLEFKLLKTTDVLNRQSQPLLHKHLSKNQSLRCHGAMPVSRSHPHSHPRRRKRQALNSQNPMCQRGKLASRNSPAIHQLCHP